MNCDRCGRTDFHNEAVLVDHKQDCSGAAPQADLDTASLPVPVEAVPSGEGSPASPDENELDL